MIEDIAEPGQACQKDHAGHRGPDKCVPGPLQYVRGVDRGEDDVLGRQNDSTRNRDAVDSPSEEFGQRNRKAKVQDSHRTGDQCRQFYLVQRSVDAEQREDAHGDA